MKLNKWLYGATALAMLAACSDKDIAPGDEPNNGPTETTSGYLAIQINLPQDVQTRADENAGTPDRVEYADGENWEYSVQNATLVLFKTTSSTAKESDAICVSTHKLERPFAPTSPSNNNITASSLEAVEVNIDTTNESSEYLWALVMLNKSTDLPLPTKGETFKNYLEKTVKTTTTTTDDGEATSGLFLNGSIGSGSIFMTNAPLSKSIGGTTSPGANPTIQTLVKLGTIKDCLRPSLQEARENVAGCIYVERALAKLTAKVASDVVIEMYDKNGFVIKDNGLKDGTKLNMTVESSRFGVLNQNSESYIIRRTSGFPELTNEADFAWNLANSTSPAYYRMIGAVGMPELYSPLHTSPQNLYRTYWCHDPNYNSPLEDALNTNVTDFKNTTNGVFYVKENTFTVENQNYGNSTLAVFEIKFKVDDKESDLYILNDNHDVVYTSEADVTSKVYEYILGQESVGNALKASVNDGVTDKDLDLGKYLKIEFRRNDDTGVYAAYDLTLNEDVEGFTNYYTLETSAQKFKTELGATSISNLVQRVNMLFIIEKYVDGKSYYIKPIMHFGESSTKWESNGKNQTITEEAYGPASDGKKYSARNYLGRYGMVRNNWYDLNVTSFIGIGSPVVPEYKADLSDDNNEIKQYIGVETHILSWAKRTQNIQF